MLSQYISTSEEWRPVVGFEGIYAVSNFGRVRRVGRNHGATVDKVLKQRISPWGYLAVCLRKNRRSHGLCVHRLVAMAFLDPKDGDWEVNHKDFNRLNNHVSNLEWLTPLENRRHEQTSPNRKKSRGVDRPGVKLSEDDVQAIRASQETHRKLAQQYGVHHSTIGNIKRLKKWKHV